MKNKIPALLALALALFLAGCASSFKPVNREGGFTAAPADSSALPLAYRSNLLESSDNLRYANMASEAGLQYVAVKVTNNTSRPLSMKTDVVYSVNKCTVNPVEVRSTFPLVRQSAGAYAAYLLLMPFNIYGYKETCDYGNGSDGGYGCKGDLTFFPVGVILGPVLAFVNMARASGANEAFAKEFGENDLYEKVLQPGETATGYLALFDRGSGTLAIRPR